jgi:polyhydroxyalkanoate synthesis regulator phasin
MSVYDDIAKKFAESQASGTTAIENKFKNITSGLNTQMSEVPAMFQPQRNANEVNTYQGGQALNETLANAGLTGAGTNVTASTALQSARLKNIGNINTQQNDAVQTLRNRIADALAQQETEKLALKSSLEQQQASEIAATKQAEIKAANDAYIANIKAQKDLTDKAKEVDNTPILDKALLNSGAITKDSNGNYTIDAEKTSALIDEWVQNGDLTPEQGDLAKKKYNTYVSPQKAEAQQNQKEIDTVRIQYKNEADGEMARMANIYQNSTAWNNDTKKAYMLKMRNYLDGFYNNGALSNPQAVQDYLDLKKKYTSYYHWN